MNQKRILIRLYPFLFLINACTPKDENKAVFAQVTESLIEGNAFFKNSNSRLFDALQARSNDPKTHGKAEIWMPKALEVQSLADSLILYIDSLKNVLSKRRGADTENVNKVKAFFITEAQSDRLYHKLTNYKMALKNIDAQMNQEILLHSFFINKVLDSIGNAAQFAKTFFASSTTGEAKAFLNSLQNNILQLENICLLFFFESTTPETGHYHSWPETVVAQNAQILKAGGDLEIMAGVASFQRLQGTKVTVGSKNVILNEKGIAVYKFKTSAKPGHYTLPVKVEFEDQDGKTQSMTLTVQYSLVDTLAKK